VRLMFDLGYGPQPGAWPDISNVGRVDALLLSHGHRDHAGGSKLREQLGDPPVYASEIVCRMLATDIQKIALPLCGIAEVLGIRTTTGRSGHAPGGIWIHLAIGGGLLYMGDNCSESLIYASDPPPPAEVAIVDASYGVYDTPLAHVQEEFDRLFDAGPVLLPIPPAGRGPEIALHLLRKRRQMPAVDDALRESLTKLATVDSECLKTGIAGGLARLAAEAPNIETADGIVLAGVADASSGMARTLVERWEDEPAPAIVFTGYVPRETPAERLIKSGRATYRRWNVHPLLSHNRALVSRVGARTVLPAFGDAQRYRNSWADAFRPARIVVSGTVEW
jgi:Cft2 family RNA processing exonuclease